MYHCGIYQICTSGIEHMLHLKRERERNRVRTAVNEKERANERAGRDEKMRERREKEGEYCTAREDVGTLGMASVRIGSSSATVAIE